MDSDFYIWLGTAVISFLLLGFGYYLYKICSHKEIEDQEKKDEAV